MQTDFGLVHLWQQGDIVTRAVALLLLGMSLATWVVLIVKALDLRRYARQAGAVEAFWHAADFADGLNRLGTDPVNPFRALALEGRQAAAHHNAQPQLHDSLDASDWLTRTLRNAIDDWTARMQGGLAVLASVGSTAPFIGLFGTVWGIYHALLAIAAAGSITIDKVAGPVGEALVMTAAGLAVAIPAVLAYNLFGKWVGATEAELEGFAHDLREMRIDQAQAQGH